MPQPFKITLKHVISGEATRLEGEFPDAEWSQLLALLHCSERLGKCRLNQSQSQIRFKFTWERGRSVVHDVALPPEDDIAAFLHLMRPVVLEREPAHFYRVKNILARRITIPRFHTFLDRVKDRYAGKLLGFTIEVGDMSLTAPEALDKWLNAFEYHHDADKRADLTAMFEVFPEPSARVLFLTAMMERAVAVGSLGQVIHSIRARDHQERTFTP